MDKARRRAALAVTISGLLLVPATPALGAPAAPAGQAPAEAGPVPTITMKAGIRQADLDRLRDQARRAGAEQAPTRPAQPQAAERAATDAATETTAALPIAKAASDSWAAAAANPQAVDTAPASADVLAAPIGDQPNGNLVNECFDAGGADRGIGRIHNRFTYCLSVRLEAEYWEIDSRGVPVEEEGTTTATLQVFAQGDDTDRRVRVFARFEKGSVDYDWGPIDNIFVAPNVSESLIAQCRQSFEVCQATRGPATMPWATWDNNTDWFYWDVFNREAASEGRDKIGYNQWFVETSTDDGEYQTLVPGRTAPRMMRCDSATYFAFGQTRYPKACVFSEVIPHLTYELGSDHHSVAFHIFQAQFHPNTTYPLLVPPGVPAPRDKRIPGRYVAGDPNAPGLHRITAELHPGQTKANEDHKNGACFKTGPNRDEYFDTGLPDPPDTPAEQCDEYPFASTLEGAAHPFWDFSVKAVPQRDNSVAGGLLRAYYVNDRILAWDADLDDPDRTNDKFYVHIK